MIEKFNGIIYLVIYIIHFGMLAFYTAQLLVGTRQFMDKFGIDHTAAFMVRFLGAFFLAWILMALYIMFIRPNGVEGTWSFFNLIVITHLQFPGKRIIPASDAANSYTKFFEE